MERMFDYSFVIDFLFMWIRVATPILLCALGAAICQQSGVVNLGLEGIMLISALAGVLGSAFGGNLFWGIVAGIGAALVVSTLFAYFHLILKANAVLCGTAINTMATGLTVFVLQLATGEKGSSSSLKSYSFPSIQIPLIKDIPVIGNILSGHNMLTYFALLMVVLLFIFLYKTPTGLRIRAVGENPSAASSVGLNVIQIRFLAILLCGVLAGLGGMYLSMGYLTMFTRGMVAGRGFIALAACAMGQATPFGILISAGLFSFFDGLSNVLQMLRIPSEFIQMMPYFATVLGITIYSIQKQNQSKKKNQVMQQDAIK
jgi:simple sugar transport system permease protein